MVLTRVYVKGFSVSGRGSWMKTADVDWSWLIWWMSGCTVCERMFDLMWYECSKLVTWASSCRLSSYLLKLRVFISFKIELT
jgi:hypothetical protein